MKKVLSIIMLSIMIFMPTNMAFAKDQDTKLSNLIKDSNMIMITRDQIPDGVEPLVVNSYEELEKIISNKPLDIYIQNSTKSVSTSLNNGVVVNSYFPPVSTEKSEIICYGIPELTSTVGYTYSWNDNENCITISRIDYKKAYLSRALNHSFEQDVYSASISADRKTINVYLKGTIYQFVEIMGNTYKSVYQYIGANYTI